MQKLPPLPSADLPAGPLWNRLWRDQPLTEADIDGFADELNARKTVVGWMLGNPADFAALMAEATPDQQCREEYTGAAHAGKLIFELWEEHVLFPDEPDPAAFRDAARRVIAVTRKRGNGRQYSDGVRLRWSTYANEAERMLYVLAGGVA